MEYEIQHQRLYWGSAIDNEEEVADADAAEDIPDIGGSLASSYSSGKSCSGISKEKLSQNIWL